MKAEHNNKYINKLKDLLTSTPVILALIPLIGNLFIFFFYMGYFDVYKIPWDFINYQISDVFIVSFVLISVIYIYYATNNILDFVFSFLPKVIGNRLQTFLIKILIVYFVGFLYRDLIDRLWLIVLIFGINFFVYDFGQIFNFKSGKTILERLENNSNHKESNSQRNNSKIEFYSITTQIFNKLGPIFPVSLFLLFITYSSGRFAAINQDEFFITLIEPERVILYMDNDWMILAEYNKGGLELKNDYQFLPSEKAADFHFSSKEIGPLNLLED